MIDLDISIAAGRWPDEEILTALANRALQATVSLADLEVPQGAEVSLLFSSDAEVKMLNAKWRNIDKSTNVLSFASNDGVPVGQWSPLLGDIVLAQETLEREADEQSKTFEDHLTHMIVHGFLHLVGYDHIDDDQALAMEALETSILASIAIADPYAP